MTSKIKAYDVNGIQINVGDPVMCVGDVYGLTVGKIYTVESISESGEFVRVVIDDFCYHPDDLELVKDEPIKAAGEAVRSIESKFLSRGGISTKIRDAFPEAFGDLVTATWKSGDPEEVRDELLRVAEMEGAHAVAEGHGVAHAGSVEVRRGTTDCPFLTLGDATDSYHVLFSRPDWTITVAAPKPADPTGGDPVVLAADASAKKRVLFRAEDGNWSPFRGSAEGVWMTDDLSVIERLKPETIAELMGE